MRRAHATLPASISSATSTAKESLGLPLQTAIGRGILALHEKHRKRLMILFNTPYGLAKKNRLFTDFPTVCSIQEKNGLVGQFVEIYITDKVAKHFTSSIAKTLRQKTAADLHKARFVSVMSDGSTDTTIVEQDVVNVRYVDHGNPVTTLASIQTLEHGNADGVHQGVRKELNADKHQPADSAFPTLVCANFDGAQKWGSNTHTAVIPAHKLELGILDGVKAIYSANATISPPAVPGYYQLLLGNQVAILVSPLGNYFSIKFCHIIVLS